MGSLRKQIEWCAGDPEGVRLELAESLVDLGAVEPDRGFAERLAQRACPEMRSQGTSLDKETRRSGRPRQGWRGDRRRRPPLPSEISRTSQSGWPAPSGKAGRD